MTSAPHTRPLLLLWGFMGSGKSTLGRLLAEQSGAELVDLDERIAAAMQLSIPEIFERLGEPAFRAEERAQLERLLEAPVAGRRVVALGGGALLDGALRRRALERAWVITLHAPIDAIAARTTGDGRPLLSGDGAARRAALARLYKERESAYRDVHETLDGEEGSPEQLAARLLDRWHPCSEAM